MSKFTIKEQVKQMAPYFFLAVAVILVFRISGEIGMFWGFLATAWGVISPFLYGFLLAYIMNIPASSIQRLLARSQIAFFRRRQKALSIVAVLLILIGLVAIMLSFVIPAVIDSINLFIENIPTYWESIVALIDNINQFGLFDIEINPETIFGFIGGLFANFSVDDVMQPISAIMGAGTALFRAAIAFISSIYVLVERERLAALWNKLSRLFFTPKTNGVISEITTRLNKYFRMYIHTQTIDGIILGTLATILLFVLRSPFALVLGLMLGIMNYIPYFGSIFGTLIAVVVVIFTQGFTMGLIAAGSLLIIQQIDANIIQPRLMSGSFKLSPLLVIISITIGGAIAGILGMLLAIPIVAVLKDIFDSVVDAREQRKFGGRIYHDDE